MKLNGLTIRESKELMLALGEEDFCEIQKMMENSDDQENIHNLNERLVSLLLSIGLNLDDNPNKIGLILETLIDTINDI